MKCVKPELARRDIIIGGIANPKTNPQIASSKPSLRLLDVMMKHSFNLVIERAFYVK